MKNKTNKHTKIDPNQLKVNDVFYEANTLWKEVYEWTVNKVETVEHCDGTTRTISAISPKVWGGGSDFTGTACFLTKGEATEFLTDKALHDMDSSLLFFKESREDLLKKLVEVEKRIAELEYKKKGI